MACDPNREASYQFGVLLRQALAEGKETTAGVLGHQYGPKPQRIRANGRVYAPRQSKPRLAGLATEVESAIRAWRPERGR